MRSIRDSIHTTYESWAPSRNFLRKIKQYNNYCDCLGYGARDGARAHRVTLIPDEIDCNVTMPASVFSTSHDVALVRRDLVPVHHIFTWMPSEMDSPERLERKTVVSTLMHDNGSFGSYTKIGSSIITRIF